MNFNEVKDGSFAAVPFVCKPNFAKEKLFARLKQDGESFLGEEVI
jgi:hypothetical protein